MASTAIAGSATSPPSLRAKLLTAARALHYERRELREVDDSLPEVELTVGDEWLALCLAAEVDEDSHQPADVWDEYDDIEETYWQQKDQKLQHSRTRRSGYVITIVGHTHTSVLRPGWAGGGSWIRLACTRIAHAVRSSKPRTVAKTIVKRDNPRAAPPGKAKKWQWRTGRPAWHGCQRLCNLQLIWLLHVWNKQH
jgi:hypothetical protein